MPFIPHTENDITEMLQVLNLNEISQVFNEISVDIPRTRLSKISKGLSESAMTRLMQEREPAIQPGGNFLGAGAYEHHIPAAIWEITSRGEFLTAYTPYQAEASQGTLQLIYEYQTMMCSLTGMEVANASLYDGASALAESALMALRLKEGKAKRIWVPRSLHPRYRQVLQTILGIHGISLEEIPYCFDKGNTDLNQLPSEDTQNLAAIIISQPNFFGSLEAVDELTDFAHQHGALAIAVVNPLALALLKEPGSWGKRGADIVCGEGQPLGVPLASGGPYFGFMCTRREFIRQLPGRIVGRTHDAKGRVGFTLTLQTREQHIRRSKATSNICTNQGLLVTAATIYMSLKGPKGLLSVASASHSNARQLQSLLTEIPGVKSVFKPPFFHEFVICLPFSVAKAQQNLYKQGIQPGYDLSQDYPELENCLLVCATETKTQQDLTRFQQCLAKVDALNASDI